MSTTLTNGIIIPDNGSRNWGGDLANNWNIIDLNVGYMSDVKNSVTTLENSVTTLENSVTTLENSVTTLENSVTTLENSVTTLENSVTTLENSVTTLENSVAENTANIQNNASNISTLQTSKQDVIEDLETIRAGASAGGTAVQPSTLSNYVDLSSGQTISGAKTFSNIITSNKELNYRDTTYDWSDASVNTWCDAGHVTWLDKTGSRRIHELVGANNGTWNKACYINEQLYFLIQSDLQIKFWGNNLQFNDHKIECIDSSDTNYIRYTNGFQICWGSFLGITTSQKTISYPKAFSTAASISVNGQSGIYVTVNDWTNSTFSVVSTTSSNESARFLWIAVGRWK